VTSSEHMKKRETGSQLWFHTQQNRQTGQNRTPWHFTARWVQKHLTPTRTTVRAGGTDRNGSAAVLQRFCPRFCRDANRPDSKQQLNIRTTAPMMLCSVCVERTDASDLHAGSGQSSESRLGSGSRSLCPETETQISSPREENGPGPLLELVLTPVQTTRTKLYDPLTQRFWFQQTAD